ncbi:MAG TPA: condensation domain-containing protein [Mycobacteriales bacterium]|nr:condensation domain-containing protein [Mycobacteriales bacterium]
MLVPFAGAGSGVGPLSWGQQLMWNAIQRWDSSLALGGVSPLQDGMTTKDVAAALSFIMSRHQSLRTRIVAGPDGVLRQEVAGAGEIVLELVDVPAGADPAAVAERVRDRFHGVQFEYANEWPVRMAVIRVDGAPVYLVAMYCHLALDGSGLDALVADVAGMEGAGPVTAIQPLAQAEWETGPDGQRHNARTLRYWDRQLRAIPARRFSAPAGCPPPRFREIQAQSPALDLATRLIAARTGVDTPAVLLAASATALARVTGNSPSAMLILVSNRFRSGFADTVSTVSQPGLCVIDVAGATFDEAVARAWRASLNAYKYAYCDPTQRDALHARISAERGEDVDISCYFNDRRMQGPAGPVPTAADIRAALPASWVRWSQTPFDPASEPFFVYVNDVPGTIDLRVSLDTRHVAPADAEAYVRELEAAAVAAALDPTATTGSRGRELV